MERTTELSDDLIQALDESARAAIDVLGRFVVTLEEALPQKVKGTSEVTKKVTDSALEMAQQLIHTQSEFLRKVITAFWRTNVLSSRPERSAAACSRALLSRCASRSRGGVG